MPSRRVPLHFFALFSSPALTSAGFHALHSSCDALVKLSPAVCWPIQQAFSCPHLNLAGDRWPWNVALSWFTCSLSVPLWSRLLWNDFSWVIQPPSLLSAPSLGELTQPHGFTSDHPHFVSRALAASRSSSSPMWWHVCLEFSRASPV